MLVEERQQSILKVLKLEGRVLVKAIAEQLGVSIDTIRRDLMAMEKRGLLKRTHGGAIPAQKVRALPQPNEIRYSDGSPEEKAMAKVAAAYISLGDTVFISSAHLHYVMLPMLPRDFPYSVVTNSIVVADYLRTVDNIDTYLVGGKIRPSGSVVDGFAVEFLKGLKLDLCFLVGGGLTAEFGVSMSTSDGALIQRTAARAARRVICLSTKDKLGTDNFARVVSADRLDVVITESDASEDERLKLQELGITVLVASLESNVESKKEE